MKRQLAIGTGALFALLCGAAPAAETVIKASEVPQPVMASVKKKYPKAALKGFEKEQDKGQLFYEIKLQDGRRRIEVKLSPDGKIQQEEEVIGDRELPRAVLDAFRASEYGSLKIKQIERVITSENAAQPGYELEVRRGALTIELLYDGAGKLLSKAEENDEKEKDR